MRLSKRLKDKKINIKVMTILFLLKYIISLCKNKKVCC